MAWSNGFPRDSINSSFVEYFDYGEEGLEIEEFLEESQQLEEQRLEEELERIEHQLEERDRIFEKHREELETRLEWYLDRLEKAYKLTGPVDELKHKIEDFYRLIRDERLQHWRDRQELEKERRELLNELRELEDTDIGDLL